MIYEQSKTFCIFFILGILCGFIFDFFRALRKNIKTNNIITYMEDIGFFLIIGLMLLRSILLFSNGEIRFYIFFAIILGIIIYILTIGNLCVIMFNVIFSSLKNFLIFFIKIIKIPIKLIKSILKKIQKKLVCVNPKKVYKESTDEKKDSFN